MSSNEHLSDRIVERMERIAGIGHWRWEITSGCLFWSQGVYDIHGIDFNDYSPSVEAAIDAYLDEDRQIVEDALTYALENKKEFKIEARIKRPDGDIRHIISQGECETNETGEIIALFGIVQDITQIKQQEKLYQLSAMASNAAIWDWDVQQDKLRWAGRSAQVLGYALNEALPRSTLEFFDKILHPDDRELVKQSFERHFTKLEEFNIEIRIKRYDGTYEWFLARAQAQFNSYGKAIRVCGSMNSIQDLKEIQAKLENSNSDLENFACMSAHELKRPIRSIASYLELLRISNQKLNDEEKDFITKSVEIAGEANHMVDELLAYASLEGAPLDLEDINTEQLTKLIVRAMKEEIKQTGANVKLRNLPNITGDQSKLKTVISNILQNALKYTADRKPEIEINVVEDNNFWQYTVKDNGRGMREEDIDKVFNMFERASNIGDVKGTGIGLAICERIINLHKGAIWIKSNIDEGTTLYFTVSKTLKQ